MNQNRKTVAITGANGFIGSHLVDYFSGKDWTVRAFQRKPANIQKNNVSYHHFSLDQKINENDFIGADWVVHCAYQIYTPKQKDSDSINIKGTKQLINICRKHKIGIIFLSSFSAHEQAESHYGKNKLELEGYFDQDIDCILRPGLVLGKGGLIESIVDIIKKNKIIPLVDGGNQPIQTILIEDLCKIVETIIIRNLAGKYNVATTQVYTMKDLYIQIINRLHLKRYFVPVPLGLIYLIIRIIEALRIPFGINSENVLGLKHMIASDTSDDLKKLGIEVLPLQQSIERLL